MSLSPELLTLEPPGDAVGSAGERNKGDRIGEIEVVLGTGDAAVRSSASSRSRRSLTCVNLGNG